MKQKITKWLKENSMIALLLSLFFIVPIGLRMIDETSAAFDAGILHTIVVVAIIYSLFQAFTWSIVRVIWPDLGDYLKTRFSYDFSIQDKRFKICLSVAIYFLILFSFIVLTCAIL